MLRQSEDNAASCADLPSGPTRDAGRPDGDATATVDAARDEAPQPRNRRR